MEYDNNIIVYDRIEMADAAFVHIPPCFTLQIGILWQVRVLLVV